jgi:hypothetical protein
VKAAVWGGIHPARRFQPALAGLKLRRVAAALEYAAQVVDEEQVITS